MSFFLKAMYNTYMSKKIDLAEKLHNNEGISFRERIDIVYHLSLPGILAQIAEIVMQYIDAAMVGTLGAAASTSIGLVSSATWMFGGCMSGCVSGFSVQIAQAIGAGDFGRSRKIYKQSLTASLLVSAFSEYLVFFFLLSYHNGWVRNGRYGKMRQHISWASLFSFRQEFCRTSDLRHYNVSAI